LCAFGLFPVCRRALKSDSSERSRDRLSGLDLDLEAAGVLLAERNDFTPIDSKRATAEYLIKVSGHGAFGIGG
jgi:hypothetical protein